MKKSSTLIGSLFGLGAFLVYSIHDIFIKYLGAIYSPFQIIFYAFMFALIPMVIVILSDKRAVQFRPNNIKLLLFRSISGLIGVVSAFHTISVLTIAEAYALLFFAPIIVTILSVIYLDERIRFHRSFAIILGFAGVVVVLNPANNELSIGHLTGVLAASCVAINAVIMRKIGNSENSLTLFLTPFLVMMLASFISLPIVYKPMPITDYIIMAIVGVLALIAGMMMQFSYKKAEASIIGPLQYSQIIWASAFSYFIFDEKLKTNVIAGIMLIVTSGLITLWREYKISKPHISRKAPRWRIDFFSYAKFGSKNAESNNNDIDLPKNNGTSNNANEVKPSNSDKQ